MPIRDEQLERSLRAAAPRVATGGVFDRVAHKRARRRTIRRIEVGSLAFVLVAALSVAALSVAVVLVRANDQSARVAAPGGRVITGGGDVTQGAGTARAPVPITLDPDQGYVRGPLVVSSSTVSLAAYDHDGDTFTYPPSRIVRLDDRTFREDGRTDLKAEILSIADGEGARWVVTRNPKPPNGLPDAFLKRIGADGAVSSKLLPFGSDPVGDVALGAGAVWVPLRDGVVSYDPATGRLGRITLTPSDSRDVVILDGAAWVTDGNVLRRLVPLDGAVNSVSLGSPNEHLLGVATAGNDGVSLVLRNAAGEARYVQQNLLGGNFPVSLFGTKLPRGFTPISIATTDGRTWVEGTVNGAPAVVLLGGKAGIRSTVVLDNGRDASFAWVSDDTVLAVSNGTLLRIGLKK